MKILPTDPLPALRPRHQSLWFPVARESDAEGSQDEPVATSPPPLPTSAPVNGLGWKAPRRVHVPVFERDAAQENTTPGSVPSALVDACIYEGALTANDETALALALALADALGPNAVLAPAGTGDRVVDAEFDPDFQEVASSPSEHERREAAGSGSRDGATPNDGVVPQGIQVSIDGGGNDDTFSCALWSNGTFTIYPSDGPRLTLNRRDSRALILYVGETLSDRVRIEG